MAILGNDEHKQRINLSSLAQNVINLDRNVIEENGTLSGFLNRIIENFRDIADASIDESINERKYQLQKNGYTNEIIQTITNEYRDSLINKIRSYPQGQSFIFRLNNDNFEYLYNERHESENYPAPSKYLKALIEEYTRLSPSEREGVYYRQLVEETIQNAIDTNSLLSVKVNSNIYWVKPYCVMADQFNSHLYLVGMSRPEGEPDKNSTIASFRITRISNIRRRKNPSGKVTINEQKAIEKKIQQVGVQYLIGEEDYIKLRLTKTGQREFMQRSYMRPYPDKIENDMYYFSCTQLNIMNYFFSFGADVEILEPISLRHAFISKYTKAFEVYKKM